MHKPVPESSNVLGSDSPEVVPSVSRTAISRRAFLLATLSNTACGGGGTAEGVTTPAGEPPPPPPPAPPPPGSVAPLAALPSPPPPLPYPPPGPAPAPFPPDPLEPEPAMSDVYKPPTGRRANANLNSAADVDYDLLSGVPLEKRWWNGYSRSSSFGGMLGYSGSVWAPGYSANGAIIVKGGGHGANIGQLCYTFNFSTLKWEQVGAERNLPANLEWAGWSDFAISTSWTAAMDKRTIDPPWYDFNHNGSFIKFDEHSYLQTAYISPKEGGGAKGSLLLPQTTFHQGPENIDSRTGVALYWSPHTFALTDGTMARAAAAPFGRWAGYSATVAVKDSRRGRLWYLVNAGSQAYFHDLRTGPPYTRVAHNIQKKSGGSMVWCIVSNATWLHVPEADAFVGFYPENSNEAPPAIVNAKLGVQILKMDAAGLPVDQERNAAVGTIRVPRGGLMIGAAWVPASAVGGVGKFYLYEGFGDDACYTLTPSSLDFGTCTWTWGREQFTNAHVGADPIARSTYSAAEAQVYAPMGRFVYVPALRSLAWHDGPSTSARSYDGVVRGGVVQLWRPPGTPT